MSLNDLANLGQVVGAIAVVILLIFHEKGATPEAKPLGAFTIGSLRNN
jgi:hypothetical protein